MYIITFKTSLIGTNIDQGLDLKQTKLGLTLNDPEVPW
jgi:hypothetical protein